MSYSVTYSTLPSLTINNIGYTFSGSIAIGNASWTNSGPVTLPSGVWLCTMNAWTSGSLGSNQGSNISIATLIDSINSQHVATCGAVGGNQGSNTACSLTAVFTNPPPLYFNLYSGPPATNAFCGYSYTRLA
jgi:hypothetical protein